MNSIADLTYGMYWFTPDLITQKVSGLQEKKQVDIQDLFRSWPSDDFIIYFFIKK